MDDVLEPFEGPEWEVPREQNEPAPAVPPAAPRIEWKRHRDGRASTRVLIRYDGHINPDGSVSPQRTVRFTADEWAVIEAQVLRSRGLSDPDERIK